MRLFALALLAALALALPAVAQDGPKVDAAAVEEAKKAVNGDGKKSKEGFWWEKNLTLGASGSLLFNNNFVGQQDGLTAQAGAFINGGLTLGYDGHEWRNSLKLEESLIKTPSIDAFLKAADNLDVQSLYLYRIAAFPYVGPFAQVRMQSQVLPGFTIRDVDTRVLRVDADGNVEGTAVKAQQQIDLTNWFEPLTLSESAGAYIEPPKLDPWIQSSFKIGASAQHVFAYGGYVLNDDAATEELELKQLTSTHSMGAEATAELSGKALDNLGWGVTAGVYYPLLIASDVEYDWVERTHVDLGLNGSVKLAKWVSIDGVVKVKRAPFVINDWQIQTALLLTAGFDLL